MAPISNEAFLAACIKYAKEKVTVDFDALAKELDMSKGGASIPLLLAYTTFIHLRPSAAARNQCATLNWCANKLLGSNKYRIIMKQFEDGGAAWTNKDGKDETKATSATVVKRKVSAKEGIQVDKKFAKITDNAKRGNASDEAEDGPPKKKPRAKATKTKAAKLAEGIENDDDVEVSTTIAQRPKGKGAKKFHPETPDGGNLGDDEATPGSNASGAGKVVHQKIPAAMLVGAATKVVKTEVVDYQEENSKKENSKEQDSKEQDSKEQDDKDSCR
ncbi:uncharacterized protein Z519_02597 [Cladophialophora bantiana CBS 173.52]|uniref:Myb-like DNA-binding domain-containing protein n=1 Tax=Cladophialophora bantiana (strain ATCC 10958 / CBS 173.52 / CDC B-1940 / NIH 8579) TaxID=1442370 RepID=A0A0D2I1Z9_CLAB1|nr:uncharacterized protein Z519_02597 [Cladophialophora bantiana CBS 173.52]KIW97205.1 hypothetical protein Z519_02597 [Cladophialophora bantiana CBS 173.52]